MLKALMKKQFLEMNTFYFQDRKTGKRRSRSGIIGFVALYIVLFVGLASAFFAVARTMSSALIPLGLGWLYYALMGLISLAFGVIGSVFNTYAGLYHAKDNELLLAMPIPPRRILLVRMVGVYAMGMLYTCLIMIPTIVAGQLAAPGVGALALQILLTLLLGLVVLTLTCLLGWVVALIAARLKNKSFVTVLITLALLVIYYVVYFRISGFLNSILEHAEDLSRAMRPLYPIYAFGRAAEGDVPSFLAFAAITVVLAALCVLVMSRSFIRIVTMNRGEGGKKTDYRARLPQKAGGVRSALVRRELKHFTASPTYMLNCGLGLVLMIALAAAALIKMNVVRDALDHLAEGMPGLASALPVLACAAVIMLGALNPVTAPSISLEGKTLWLLQSLPVSAAEVLRAKLRMHLFLCAGPTVLCAAVLAVVLRLPAAAGVCMALTALLAVAFFGLLGLILNLKRPSFQWTNEAIPVKQSMPVFVVIFGGWFLAALFVGAYFLLRRFFGAEVYLPAAVVVLAALCAALRAWLLRRGTAVFEAL